MALALVAAVGPRAHAQAPRPAADRGGPAFRAEVAAGTRFPLELGVEGAVETPIGLTARLGIGWMPGAYVDSINATAVLLGAYDDDDATLIAAVLDDAIWISPTIGWRLPSPRGLEIYGGYVLGFLGGELTRAEVEEITDEDLGELDIDSIPLDATSHGFQVGVAYQVALRGHLALRVSVAYFQIVASSTRIDARPPGQAAERVVDRAEAALDDRMRDLMTSYVKTPLLGVAGVWQF